MRLALVFLTGALVVSPPLMAQDEPTSGDRPGNELVIEGEASYYGGKFNGRKTATGERFDEDKMTAASKELPLGSKATVTNEETGESVDVKVNDRGPYAKGRVMDVSKGAAKELDMIDEGTAPVRIEVDPDEQPSPQLKEKVEDLADKQQSKTQK